MKMKTVIVCASVSHGNTGRVADSMAQVLDAKVVSPEQADLTELADADLVGFGSGVFYILLAELNAAGRLDWSRACVDGSHIRVKKGEPTPVRRRSTGGRRAANTT
ncbi:NADPH-dependent FMN reductase family protein [Streptomyces lavendulae]|uniref:hypothetical protein n=1 Tax=Streptomyces lavendulae TaxID=1914 RepID=UPI003696EE27